VLLPRGRTLPDDVWLKRHHALVWLMVFQAVGLSIFAAFQGQTLPESALYAAVVLPIAAVAVLVEKQRRLASMLVAAGLITESALLVQIWDGMIEAHFMFFVMVVALSLYEDWLPFLVAVAYVVLHHGLIGVSDPESVYSHADAIEHPWKWAGIHGFFVAAAAIFSIAAWGMNETVRAESKRAAELGERTKAERDVERSKDEFFALVSHELRTPLTSIIGYTDMLAKTESETLSARGNQMLDVVRRNAKREMRLVGDLLMLVRIEAGKFQLEPGRVSLRPLVEAAVEAATPAAEKAGHEIALWADDIPELEGDAERLGQAVDNLLTNAIKFTPDGGRIEVRLCQRDGNAEIEVEDTGPGIAREDAERLFDRLYRASSATADHVAGTGLGLTIVKGIVEAHGGVVVVESEPGSGTTFRIELPLEPPPGEPGVASEPREAVANGNGNGNANGNGDGRHAEGSYGQANGNGRGAPERIDREAAS
jgi:signal transduction histidine kinase